MTMDKHFNFIKKYQLEPSICDGIIKFFDENEGFHKPGEMNDGVDLNRKSSTDLVCNKEDFQFMGEYGEKLYDIIADYIHTVVRNNGMVDCGELGMLETFNIQKYPAGGGYPAPHMERGGTINMDRELVWMTYLTDTPNGGTAFPQWDYVSECKKGLTLVWPAHFTHIHHGVVSEEHEKMIITGWINYAPIGPKGGS